MFADRKLTDISFICYSVISRLHANTILSYCFQAETDTNSAQIARNPINQCIELHPLIIYDIRKVIEENIKYTAINDAA